MIKSSKGIFKDIDELSKMWVWTVQDNVPEEYRLRGLLVSDPEKQEQLPDLLNKLATSSQGFVFFGSPPVAQVSLVSDLHHGGFVSGPPWHFTNKGRACLEAGHWLVEHLIKTFVVLRRYQNPFL